MLKRRILTALILIPLFVLTIVYLPPLEFLFVTAFITLMGAWEWAGLIGINKRFLRFVYILFVALASFMMLWINVQWIFLFAFMWWLIALFQVVLYPRGLGWSKHVLVRGLMGIFVLVPSWAAINFIRNQDNGLFILLFFCVLIWGADSVAYFVGNKFGSTKLARQVSPAKSIEGLSGAIIFGLAFALFIMWLGSVPIEVWPWGLALSVVTVLFSVIGDLFESMQKRIAGVKDSGRLLPGHGGVMDRIDSLTAAAPVFALGGLLLGTYL